MKYSSEQNIQIFTIIWAYFLYIHVYKEQNNFSTSFKYYSGYS